MTEAVPMQAAHQLQLEELKARIAFAMLPMQVSIALRNYLEFLAAGGKAELNPPQAWTVSADVVCNRCHEIGQARLALATFGEFDKQIQAGKFQCQQCGGDLSYAWQKRSIVLLEDK